MYRTDNQFVTYRVPIKQFLNIGENILVLTFESTFLKVRHLVCFSLAIINRPANKGRDLEKEHGKLNLWNGDSSRLHVRKSQYK